MAVRIMVVDDHEVVRVGLAAILHHYPDLEVVGQAGSGQEAIAKARELKPDVILMDIRMPGISGVEACRAIVNESPQTKVIMLTSYDDEEAITESIKAGATGYVLKQIGS